MGRAKGLAQAATTSEGRADLIVTAGQVFPDGRLLELVRDPSDPNRPGLLYWDGEKVTISAEILIGRHCYVPLGTGNNRAAQLDHQGLTCEPTHISASVWHAMRLPAGAVNFGTTRELFDHISELFKKYLAFSDSQAALIALFSVSTWLVDCLPSAPCLSISGADSDRAMDLLRLLHCVCRRPLLLTNVTPAGLPSLPLLLQPTLLIHQVGLSPKTRRLLLNSRHRGLYIPGKSGSLVTAPCSQVVFTGLEDHAAQIGDGIHFTMPPTEPESIHLDDDTQVAIAEQFQPWLLMYRLRHLMAVRTSTLAAPRLTFPTRALARNLGACVPDDPELAQDVIRLLKPQDDEVRAQRCCDPHAAILESVLAVFHATGEEKGKVVGTKKIADLTNALLLERGEILAYSAAEIGWKLNELGLSRHRGRSGRVLRLDRETSRLVHRLARDYGVLSERNKGEGCPDCG